MWQSKIASFFPHGSTSSVLLCFKLSFGGIPLPGKPGTFLRKNFHGCMENLYYNGISIIDLAKRRKPQIHSVVSWTFPFVCACLIITDYLNRYWMTGVIHIWFISALKCHHLIYSHRFGHIWLLSVQNYPLVNQPWFIRQFLSNSNTKCFPQ